MVGKTANFLTDTKSQARGEKEVGVPGATQIFRSDCLRSEGPEVYRWEWLWKLVRTRRHCWQTIPGVSVGWAINHNLKAQLLLELPCFKQRLGMTNVQHCFGLLFSRFTWFLADVGCCKESSQSVYSF